MENQSHEVDAMNANTNGAAEENTGAIEEESGAVDASEPSEDHAPTGREAGAQEGTHPAAGSDTGAGQEQHGQEQAGQEQNGQPSAELDAELGLLRARVAQLEAQQSARAAELRRLQVLDAVRTVAVRQGVELEDRALSDAYELHLLDSVNADEDGALQGVEAALESMLAQRPHFVKAPRAGRPQVPDIDAVARSTTQSALETPAARHAAARLLRGF